MGVRQFRLRVADETHLGSGRVVPAGNYHVFESHAIDTRTNETAFDFAALSSLSDPDRPRISLDESEYAEILASPGVSIQP
jgi:hypothetical protein